MTTPDLDAPTVEIASTTREPEAARKAKPAAAKPRVAPTKAKSAKKATPAQKRARTPRKAKSAKPDVRSRPGSKTANILELLKRGATLKELMKATGWQAHSVRGFLSGTVGKKMGLAVVSVKEDDGERRYSMKA